MKKSVLYLAMLWAVSGCTTWSLEELRHAEPKGNAFQTALAKEYLAFSDLEAQKYDWIDSKHFAEKGLVIMYGTDVGPEELSEWDIPKDILPELQSAREKLISHLTADNMSAKPEVLARAQAKFDCWAEEQEENWQTDDIAACREGFEAAIAELEGAPKEEAKPLVTSTSYMVFFDYNRATLNAEGNKIVDSAVEDMKRLKEPYEIVLNGHADLSGAQTYNLALSQKRVAAVKKALMDRGIAEKYINVFAFGETDPRIATKDGVKEKANRRVEIFING